MARQKATVRFAEGKGVECGYTTLNGQDHWVGETDIQRPRFHS